MAQIDSVGHALKALRRRAVLIGVLLTLGTGLSLWMALTRERVYEAFASVQIETPQVTVAAGSTPTNPIETRIRLIEQKLLSRETLLALANDMDLLRTDPALTDAMRVDMLRDSVQIQRFVASTQSWRTELAPTGLLIGVRMNEAQLAANVANALLDLVMREERARAARRADNTLSFFETEEARVSAEIATVEAQIAQLKTDRAGALPEATAARTDRLAVLSEAQLALEQQVISFETNRDRLRDEEARRQAALLEQQSFLIADRIAEVKALINAAPEVERELNMLERNRTRLQDEYTVVTTRRADAAMSQVLENSAQTERFEVLETALVPELPISTSRRELALTGFLISLLIALGVALALEWMSPYLRTSAQIERTLGIRPVIVIPDLRVPPARRLN